MRQAILLTAGLLAVAGSASAAIVDGNRDGTYGPSLAVQTTGSSFGNGNSLANAAAQISGGNLHLFLGSRLNNGFERIVVLIDSKAGGQNVLNGVGALGGANGMTLDTGFEADYAIVANGNSTDFFVDFTELGVGGTYAGQGTYGAVGGTLTGGTANGLAIGAIRDQGAGVPFGFGPLSPAEALAADGQSTGFEYSIPLANIGLPAGAFKVMAFIAGGDGSTTSTQFLGGVGDVSANGIFTGYQSLAGLNLSQISGDQFFVVPAPGAAALLGLGGLLAARRRR
jgi:hypothetical protein